MGTVNTYYKISFSKTQVYFLKIDEVGCDTRLENEISVFKNLDQEKNKLSFTFPFPLLTKDKRFYIKYGNKSALVFPRIHGRAKFANLKTKHLKIIGRKLAELNSVRILPNIKPHRFDFQGIKKAHASIQRDLKIKHPNLNAFVKSKIILLEKKNLSSSKKVLIHADLFPENIHWQNDKLIGILDYEAAGLGSHLFDISVAIHALCHDGKKFDQSKIKSFLKGYSSRRKFTLAEKKQLPFYMELAALRFLITRLKDFELPGISPTVENFKDYREYVKRFDEIDSLNHIFMDD